MPCPSSLCSQAALREDMKELERLLWGGGGAPASTGEGAEAKAGKAGGAHSAVNVEAQDAQHGFTALALATAAGRIESAKMLLAAKANVNAKDKYGKGPLMWAAAAGNEKLAQLLCKHGADLHAQDKSGWDALFAAAHGGHVRLVTVWLLNKARALALGTRSLARACRRPPAFPPSLRRAPMALSLARANASS